MGREWAGPRTGTPHTGSRTEARFRPWRSRSTSSGTTRFGFVTGTVRLPTMSRRPPLELSRAQILGFRRHVGELDERLPSGRRSLRAAAWAGLQDSMPRAALLSIHARVADTTPSTLQDPSLVQIWGPRYSAYAVPARDVAPFTLGRLPVDDKGRARAVDMAAGSGQFSATAEWPPTRRQLRSASTMRSDTRPRPARC